MRALAGFALAALFVAGCGSSDKKSTSEPVSSGGARSPTEMALAHIKAEQTQAARVSTTAESSPEGGGPTTVTILQDGIADDSVAAVRNVLRYEPDGDGWRLVSATRTQRCRAGRGHQNFGPGDCL